MTWPLVKLRVSAMTFAGVKAALLEAGDEGLLRIKDKALNLDGVVLVEETPDNGLWPCCGFARSGGHNSSCTFYGCDEHEPEPPPMTVEEALEHERLHPTRKRK